ncbi:MAG: T9SS type A sorting domain-containing protein, partial [Firmicutes bacterium]|nr:T9SS type A sorting domain-containing protein [Bacillota bacterium]
LTVNEIKDIIRITAINDQWTGDAKNNKSTVWGWGKIDAHAIMKYLESTSIEEFENTISFTAYPNPVVNNEITISISDTVCGLPFVVNIYDASGRLVFLSSMQDVKTFDISRLDSGFYFIKLDNGRYSAVQKIVVGR